MDMKKNLAHAMTIIVIILCCVVSVNGSESDKQRLVKQIEQDVYRGRYSLLQKILPQLPEKDSKGKPVKEPTLRKIIEFWGKQIIVSRTKNPLQFYHPLCAHFIAWKHEIQHITAFCREPSLCGPDYYSFVTLDQNFDYAGKREIFDYSDFPSCNSMSNKEHTQFVSQSRQETEHCRREFGTRAVPEGSLALRYKAPNGNDQLAVMTPTFNVESEDYHKQMPEKNRLTYYILATLGKKD
jgi:hypothetical protein